ncbi:MAG: deoxyribodipyrimidine photo-lyase [Actinomycetota bacterium]
MDSSVIMWFRRDLRLDDNPAWAAATSAGADVTPLLVVEPGLLETAGPHRRRAFLTAADALDRALIEHGARLHVRTGNPATILPALANETGASTVFANADVSRWAQRRDAAVESALGATPIEWHWGTLAHAPGTILTQAGTLSKVFTPFAKRWFAVPLRPEAQPGTASLASDPGDGLPELDNPRSPSLSDTRVDEWQADIDAYATTRDLPAIDGTSRLSTALRFGTVSPRSLAEAYGVHTPGREGFVRQLAWRDWYAHLTYQFPNIDRHAIRPEYDNIEWQHGPDVDDEFQAWADGQTGYPIVDAGMRQLAQTGWMHNRVRMITASFLVKDLLIDWRRGERHFRHLLSDAEPSQNAGNWQWVAGTGTDAAPYFRIFNPTSQSKKFDPAGDYIRQWVPELASLDKTTIHEPAAAAPLDLAAAGVVLGDTYPAPIVNHAVARDRTLAAYKTALGR